MSFICVATLGCGVLFSKTLFYFGLSQPVARYGLSVLFSYAVFFALIYLWLRWHFDVKSKWHTDDSLDTLDLLETSVDVIPSQTAQAGGDTGASSSVADDLPSVGDFDEGAVILVVVGALALISGSALYVVYSAPEILFEAAFETILVAGLFRRGKKVQAEGWTYSIFKRTWLPFAVVLLMALLFGFTIQNRCPGATSFHEYRELCWEQDKI